MPPSSKPNTNTNTNTDTNNMSTYAMVKAAGFTSFYHFLLSYNLRIYEPDDVNEGKAILEALFQQDAK
jgi:hypothetical protein